MRILIITKRFPPEVPATAVLCQELAEDLARLGHEVTVAAGYPHHPYGRVFPGYKVKALSVKKEHGYRLVRGWHLVHPSPAIPVRALIMASQCASSFLCASYARRPQVVISFDGFPLLGPLTAAWIARFYGAKLVSVIYDLFPDAVIDYGILTNPGLIAIARKVENLIYRSSDSIVVLSEGFRRTLTMDRGVDPAKVAVIPVWLDEKNIVPLPRDNPWRREAGIPPEKFVVLYAGTIGLAAGAEVLVEAARHLSAFDQIHFLLVGDGYGKDRVEALAREQGLTNFSLLPFQPRERLSELQATADVSLVTLAPGRGWFAVPSKILGYMAAGRPVIAAVDAGCDTAEMLTEAGCGMVVPPGEGQGIAQAILHYWEHPEDREAAGQRGRAYFLNYLERKTVTKRYAELLIGLLQQ